MSLKIDSEMPFDESENLFQLMDFLNSNSERTLGGKKMRHHHFIAAVNYFSRGVGLPFETSVRVHTDARAGGEIVLEEKNCCPAEFFHLDFNPKYQVMQYDEVSRSLLVSGDSKKMGGAYKVSIVALAPIV